MTRLFFAATLVATALIPQVLDAQLFQRGAFRTRGRRNFVPQQRSPIFQNQRGFVPRNGFQNQPTPSTNLRLGNSQAMGQKVQQLKSVLQQPQSRMQIRPVISPNNQLKVRQTNPARQLNGGISRPVIGQVRSSDSGSKQRTTDQRQMQNSSQGNLQRIIRPGRQVQSRSGSQQGAPTYSTQSQIKPEPRLPGGTGTAQSPTQPRPVHSILVIPSRTGDDNDQAEEIEPVLELPEKTEPATLEETKTSLDITTPPIEPVEEVQGNSILKIVDPVKSSDK